MSKIGKKPVIIKEGVTVTIDNGKVTVNGPKGSDFFVVPQGVEASLSDGKIIVSAKTDERDTKALFGLTRAILANMVKGVTLGFEKKLELSGVGYRANLSGSDLLISVGFSHPIKIQAIDGIQFSVVENTIVVSGIDKRLVGDVASKIRAIRKPEPYKGKGIKYMGERIRRKAGKAAKAVGAK